MRRDSFLSLLPRELRSLLFRYVESEYHEVASGLKSKAEASKEAERISKTVALLRLRGYAVTDYEKRVEEKWLGLLNQPLLFGGRWNEDMAASVADKLNGQCELKERLNRM